jgi:hypothetical protein
MKDSDWDREPPSLVPMVYNNAWNNCDGKHIRSMTVTVLNKQSVAIDPDAHIVI